MEDQMAKQVQQPAKGNAPGAGPVKTPAPKRPAAPDVISQARLGGDGYGQNSGRNNPSSVPAGSQKLSGLAANMKASVDDDGCLDRIIASGTARQDTSVTGQLRNVAAKAQPTTLGMKDPNANPVKVAGGPTPAIAPGFSAAELAAKQHGKK
jgi:hypothetical protein